MKKEIKILAGIMVVGGAIFLSGCNKQKNRPVNSLTYFGTYTGSGNVTTPEGAKATVTSSSVTLTCPPGLYVPIALINNIPAFGSAIEIIYNGTVETPAVFSVFFPNLTPPTGFSNSRSISNGANYFVRNVADQVILPCVPLSAIDSFSLA